jgi:hypothetical protein
MRSALILIFLILVCFLGCEGAGPWGIPIAGEGYDGPHPKMPGQEQAEAIIVGVYGPRASIPPAVWKFSGSCTDGSGTYPNAFNDHDGDCVNSEYYVWTDYIEVDWVSGGNFSDTGLAHEACHAFLQYTTGDADSNHASDCFSHAGVAYTGGQNGSAPDSLVDTALKALVAAGF